MPIPRSSSRNSAASTIPSGAGVPRAREKPEEFLFEIETSTRRALILALGTYGADGLDASEEQRLVATLLELYRSDPDAGIHGAAEWTLRRWKQEDNLRAIDADLEKIEDRGENRWFVNKRGQTLAVIDGPVEFRMGSPGSEPERTPGNEVPRHDDHPSPFAIAIKEVTVDQFQEFVKTNMQFQVPQSYLKQFTTAPDGPWIAPVWYAAAAYCNWLSEQERLAPGPVVLSPER